MESSASIAGSPMTTGPVVGPGVGVTTGAVVGVGGGGPSVGVGAALGVEAGAVALGVEAGAVALGATAGVAVDVTVVGAIVCVGPGVQLQIGGAVGVTVGVAPPHAVTEIAQTTAMSSAWLARIGPLHS